MATTFVAGLVLALVAPAGANLPNSTFEGHDGNLVVNTAGNADWENAPNRVRGDDLASGKGDNSFGQGTKEDGPNVSVVTGSIPPNKSDLTRFYAANEFVSNNNFLYLAWERSNVLGSANMDFEINKNTQPDLTTPGPKTLNRTAGDLLVTFDFTNGGGNPVLGLLRWLTGAPESAADCFSANALPCWGVGQTEDMLDGLDDQRVNLSAAGFAEGAVNTVAVTDPIANESLPALTFGEASINLTAAGVFPPGTCTAFGSVFLKSRSSASFPAEVKDFVAPQPVNISNCGRIIIKKVTIPSPDPTDTSFDYTAGGGLSPTSFSLKDGGSSIYDPVFAGSGYSVVETVPAHWELVSAVCDDGSPVSNIDVSPNETVTCTFTNRLLTGSIEVTKTRKHAADGAGDHPHPGVSFTINGVTKQTDANGKACFDGLLFGTYTVHETVPAGYHVDANDKQVTVDNIASCSGVPYVGETVSFHNTPLTDITASVNSQVNGGTASTIVCTDADGDTVASGSTGPDGDGSATATNLEPGTYTCILVIDP
jgi:Prealbumin-like fold domain